MTCERLEKIAHEVLLLVGVLLGDNKSVLSDQFLTYLLI